MTLELPHKMFLLTLTVHLTSFHKFVCTYEHIFYTKLFLYKRTVKQKHFIILLVI